MEDAETEQTEQTESCPSEIPETSEADPDNVSSEAPAKSKRKNKVVVPKVPKKRGRKKIEDRKPLVCDICGRVASSQTKLVLHKRTHTGEKPFSCEHCNAKFSRKDKLNVHIRSHTGERPYECPVCGKSFSIKAKLVCHERIHTGEKPYGCSTCDARFSQKDKLARHQRTHTGEKPFACPYCAKSFTRKDKLSSHMKTYHAGQVPPKVLPTVQYKPKVMKESEKFNHSVRRNPSRLSKVNHKVYSMKSDEAVKSDGDDDYVPQETEFADDSDENFSRDDTLFQLQAQTQKAMLLPFEESDERVMSACANEWKRAEELCQMLTDMRKCILPSLLPLSSTSTQQQHKCHVCKLPFSKEMALAQHLIKSH